MTSLEDHSFSLQRASATKMEVERTSVLYCGCQVDNQDYHNDHADYHPVNEPIVIFNKFDHFHKFSSTDD